MTDIRTKRLLLRAPRADDVDVVVAIQTDPRTNRFHPSPPDAEAARNGLQTWLRHWSEHGFGTWLVEVSGAVVGVGGLQHMTEDEESVLNLYYRFRPDAWGHGYATEMARAALTWADEHVPDVPVSVVTRPENTPSLAVAKKLGFTQHRERVKNGVHEVLLRR